MRVRNVHVSPLVIVHNCMVDYAERLSEKNPEGKRVTLSQVIDLLAREHLSPKYPELRKFFEMQDSIEQMKEKPKRRKSK